MSVVTDPAARRRDPGRVLWVLTGAGWLATVASMLVPAGMWGMPSMAAAGLGGAAPGPPVAWLVAVFAGAWIVMVAAMMLPTTVPMTRMFAVVIADVPRRRAVLAAFLGSYLGIWSGVGLAGLGVAAAIARVTAGVPDGLLLAGALVIAGAFQFSPLKWRCLTACRDPRSFLFTRYRRGVGAAFTLGVRHALSCVGCCWALMAVMFATGAGGIGWMLGLTAVMVVEKTAPWGRRLVRPLGVVLLAAAVVVAVAAAAPAVLGGHAGTPVPMPMPGHHL